MKELFFFKRDEEIRYSGQYTFEDGEKILVLEGEIYCGEKKLTVEEVAQYLFLRKNLSALTGLYTFVYYDKKKNAAIAAQDSFSYYHPLYFCSYKGGLIFSLSLKRLIIERGERAELQDGHVAEFLYNGFLADDRSLVKGVKKLPAMRTLYYDLDRGRLRYQKREYILEGQGKEDYFSLLEREWKEELKNAREINMALSSGFDSNLLLYVVSKINPNCKINAFCIGSCDGLDETESVEQIAACYPQVCLTVCKVSPQTLQDFPQMVYELEDSVFERGIFLQYVMAEQLKGSSLPTFFGEGADQVLSAYFTTDAAPYYHVGEEAHFPWLYNPYEMLTYVILKKNGGLLRNRNIQVRYPFLKDSFMRGVSAYRPLNGTDKTHYKGYIAERVDGRIADLLVKKPGSTNLSSLFDERNTERLFAVARNSRFFAYLDKQPHRAMGEEVHKDNCLKILYLLLFERLYCSGEALDGEKCPWSFDELLSEFEGAQRRGK